MCYLQFKQIELNIYNNNNKATKKNHIFLNPFFGIFVGNLWCLKIEIGSKKIIDF
jgi:hypothetical protein